MKKSFLLTMFMALCLSLFAQVSTNPSDKFYTQVERWEALGLINRQPELRPYPLKIVEDILNEVIAGNNDRESEIAKNLYSGIFNRPWKLKGEVTENVKANSGITDCTYALYGVDGDFKFLENMSVGYSLDFLTAYAHKGFETSELPIYRDLYYTFADPAYIGPTRSYMEVDGSYSFYYKDLFFQAGINHTSFGPFYNDSLVLSPTAKHAPVFSVSFNPKKFNYTQGMLYLTATSSGLGGGWHPGKMFMFHSLELDVTKKLSATFYETALYGNRFDLSYMIPMLYMVTQGVTGYDEDNILMGGTIGYRPIDGLLINADFYLDDIGFYGLKTYHDIKLHAAGALGVKYVPQNIDSIKMIKLNYTAVTPFMYPHGQHIVDATNCAVYTGSADAINYQAYNHAGKHLGSVLDPNSDKIALSATITPVKNLTIDLGASLIRHANVSEGLFRDEMLYYMQSPRGFYITDGTIRQSAMLQGDFLASSQNKIMFLTQPTKEYVFQADVDFKYALPSTKIGKFTVGAGYTFEYIHNYGVNNELFPGVYVNPEDGNAYLSFDGYNYYDEVTDWDDAVDNAIAVWKSQLKNIINHHFTINFKYTF